MYKQERASSQSSQVRISDHHPVDNRCEALEQPPGKWYSQPGESVGGGGVPFTNTGYSQGAGSSGGYPRYKSGIPAGYELYNTLDRPTRETVQEKAGWCRCCGSKTKSIGLSEQVPPGCDPSELANRPHVLATATATATASEATVSSGDYHHLNRGMGVYGSDGPVEGTTTAMSFPTAADGSTGAAPSAWPTGMERFGAYDREGVFVPMAVKMATAPEHRYGQQQQNPSQRSLALHTASLSQPSTQLDPLIESTTNVTGPATSSPVLVQAQTQTPAWDQSPEERGGESGGHCCHCGQVKTQPPTTGTSTRPPATAATAYKTATSSAFPVQGVAPGASQKSIRPSNLAMQQPATEKVSQATSRREPTQGKVELNLGTSRATGQGEPKVYWKRNKNDAFGTLTILRNDGSNYVLRIPVGSFDQKQSVAPLVQDSGGASGGVEDSNVESYRNRIFTILAIAICFVVGAMILTKAMRTYGVTLDKMRVSSNVPK